MDLKRRSIWFFTSVLVIILTLLLPHSPWLICINIIPVLIAMYFYKLYSVAFKFDSPWGIPQFLVFIVNLKFFEIAVENTSKYFNLSTITAIEIKIGILLAAFLIINTVVNKLRISQ